MFDVRAEEKTFAPTPARREEAWRGGRVARSRDLGASASLLAAFSGLSVFGAAVFECLRGGVRSLLDELVGAGPAFGPELVHSLAARGAVLVAAAAIPVAACGVFGGIAASVAQCGAAIRPIAFDVRRLSPAAALARLASPRNVARGALAIAKVALAGALFARAAARALLAAGHEGIPAWESWWRETVSFGIRASAWLVAIGIAEYALERWWLERDLRMTRAEREEEAARLEGKREHKSRQRKDRERILAGNRRSLEAIREVER